MIVDGYNIEPRADLLGAALRGAALRDADLRGAALRGADLRRADLRRADLRDANLDTSAFPLYCGGLDLIVDDRLVEQFLFHVDTWDLTHVSPDLRRAWQRVPKRYRRAFARRRTDLREYRHGTDDRKSEGR